MTTISSFGSKLREKCRSVAAMKNDLGLADGLVSGRDVRHRAPGIVVVCVVMVVDACVTTKPRAPISSADKLTEKGDASQPRNGPTNISCAVLVEGLWRSFNAPLGSKIAMGTRQASQSPVS